MQQLAPSKIVVASRSSATTAQRSAMASCSLRSTSPLFQNALLRAPARRVAQAAAGRRSSLLACKAAADTSTSRVEVIETVEEFDALLAKGGVTIVDFYAEWCGPCKLIAPHFERLSAAKTCANANFAKVDVGKFPKEFATRYNVRALPTFHAFVDGELKDTFIGSRSQELVCFVDRMV